MRSAREGVLTKKRAKYWALGYAEELEKLGGTDKGDWKVAIRKGGNQENAASSKKKVFQKWEITSLHLFENWELALMTWMTLVTFISQHLLRWWGKSLIIEGLREN